MAIDQIAQSGLSSLKVIYYSAQLFKCWVYGRVQGVGFRYSTRYEAMRLGLTGYARNLDDGSVEVVACGDAGQLEKLLGWLKDGGPGSARVDKLFTEPYQPEREWHNFSIRY